MTASGAAFVEKWHKLGVNVAGQLAKLNMIDFNGQDGPATSIKDMRHMVRSGRIPIHTVF